MTRVFVYGTLLKGCCNHGCLKDQKCLGAGSINGFALYNLGSYPGMVSAASEAVLGEIYEVCEQTLARLDQLEGNGWLYTRIPAEARVSNEMIMVETYVWNGEVESRGKIDISAQPWNDNMITGRYF